MKVRLSTHNAVHTQGGAHTRRSVAAAGVLLFKGGARAGPLVERSELQARFGYPHTRRYKGVRT